MNYLRILAGVNERASSMMRWGTRFIPVAIAALAAAAALADDAPKRLTAADLSVETHKWDGKTIQATGQCFFADVSEYRCGLGILGTVVVRVDFSDIEPEAMKIGSRTIATL